MKKLAIGEKCGWGRHVLTEKTLGIRRDGRQYCKLCKQERERDYRGDGTGRVRYAIGGRCRKGHVLSKRTIYLDHKGGIGCKTCLKIRAQRYYDKHRDALILYANKRAPTLTAARALLAA